MLTKNKKDRPDWEELEVFVLREKQKQKKEVKQKNSEFGTKPT